MSEEIFGVVQKLPVNGTKKQVVLQCAPLLTGIKLSNLLNVRADQKEEIPSPEEKQIETAGAIIDREAVLAALRRNGGNASRTAKELGISRSTLYRRLK